MELPKGFHNEVIEARENTIHKSLDAHKNEVAVTPLKYGGANFKTNTLIQKSSSKLVYKPTISVGLFCFVFIAVGLGVFFFSLLKNYQNSFEFTLDNWMPLLFGLCFAVAGGFMVYQFYKPIVFDKQLGLFYESYNFKLHNSKATKNKNNVIRLKNIIALQIIGEHISSDNGNYKSFELNLVLDNNTRKNVIDHGNLKAIINDASILSAFLDVPIWHANT